VCVKFSAAERKRHVGTRSTWHELAMTPTCSLSRLRRLEIQCVKLQNRVQSDTELLQFLLK
jgi:hypothetical protein